MMASNCLLAFIADTNLQAIYETQYSLCWTDIEALMTGFNLVTYSAGCRFFTLRTLSIPVLKEEGCDDSFAYLVVW